MFRRLRQHIAEMDRTRWVILGLSLLVTSTIVVLFVIESHFGIKKPTVVAYFNNWNTAELTPEPTSAQRQQAEIDAAAEAVVSGLDAGAAPPAEQ
jgi:hypothetical protein